MLGLPTMRLNIDPSVSPLDPASAPPDAIEYLARCAPAFLACGFESAGAFSIVGVIPNSVMHLALWVNRSAILPWPAGCTTA